MAPPKGRSRSLSDIQAAWVSPFGSMENENQEQKGLFSFYSLNPYSSVIVASYLFLTGSLNVPFTSFLPLVSHNLAI